LPGEDFTGLIGAEEAVALLAPPGLRLEEAGALTVARLEPDGTDTAPLDALAAVLQFDLPSHTAAMQVAALRNRLTELGHRWRILPDGEALTLRYPGQPR
jgi:hypothetical protein